MEQQLTNEEISRVFAMYAPCIAYDIVGQRSVHITGILFDEWMAKFEVEDNYDDYGSLDNFLIPITPLSKISDEDAIEVAKIIYPRNKDVRDLEYLKGSGKDWIERLFGGREDVHVYMIWVYQYLKLKGYAVPLFFGVGHWANGKTAIELKIAIEK